MRLSTRIALITGLALVLGGFVIGWSAALIARNESISAVDNALVASIAAADSGQGADPFAIVEIAQRSSYPIAAVIIFDDSPAIPIVEQFSSDGTSLMPTMTTRDAVEAEDSTTTRAVGNSLVRVHSRSLGDGGWLVLSASIDSATNRYRNTLSLTLLVALAIAALLAGIVNWVISRQFQSLSSLVHAAREIASGSFVRRSPPSKSPKEVRDLYESLRLMTEEIDRTLEDRSRSENDMREFLDETAHELRTPLTVIRGYVDILKKQSELDPVVRGRAHGRLDGESARMMRLLDDLLLLAELKERTSRDAQTVDITAVLESHCEDLRIQEPDRTITSSMPPIALIRGEQDLAERLISNIFANIRNHTPINCPLSILVEVQDENRSVRIVIDDGGSGIPPEILKRINQGAARFASDRNREAGGTGLGLSLIQGIVKKFGGTIEFGPSALGGLRVELTIPGSSTQS